VATPHKVIVREAKPDDIETVAKMVAAITEETEDRSMDIEPLTHSTRVVLDSPDKGFCLVADVAGEVVGIVLVTYIWSFYRNGTTWWIQAVYVRADWRGRGVYTSLHNQVYEAAKASGDAISLGLRVDPDNHTAKSTYSRLGMSETKSHYETYSQTLAPWLSHLPEC